MNVFGVPLDPDFLPEDELRELLQIELEMLMLRIIAIHTVLITTALLGGCGAAFVAGDLKSVVSQHPPFPTYIKELVT